MLQPEKTSLERQLHVPVAVDNASKLAFSQGRLRELCFSDPGLLQRGFRADNEFLYIRDWLPRDWTVDNLARRAIELKPLIHRSRVPGFKKGGSISAFSLAETAPIFDALYRSPDVLEFFERLVGKALQLCPRDDPHSCALYYYTEPGDRIGFHYDTSWYRGERYTVLVGLVQRSTQCKLQCVLHKDDPKKDTRTLEIATDPGTMVVFNGDKLWHAVTPLGEDEQRIVLTMEYVTDPRMSRPKRWISNLKDRIAYFGFGGLGRKAVGRKTGKAEGPAS